MNFLSADVSIEVDSSKVKSQLRTVKSYFTSTVSGMKSVTRRFSSLFTGTFSRLTRHAKLKLAGIGLSVVGVTNEYRKFEAGLANVSTMLDEQSTRYLPLYASKIKDLSIAYGQSIGSMLDATYSILSASVDPAKAMDFLATTLKTAKAGITDTNTAAYALTGIMNAYGMSAEDAGKISDILFATVKRGQTSFAKLAPAIGRVTALAAPMGVELEEVAAALSTITRAGINTNEAVTMLRSLLTALQGKSKEGIAIAHEYGIELSAQALAENKLTGALENLQGLQPDVLKSIFTETEARTALNVLLSNSTGYLGDLELAYNSVGLTQEAFEKQTSTLDHTLKQLWAVVKVISIEIGAAFAPALKSMTTGLTAWLNNNREKFSGWASLVMAYITFGKDVMVEFVGFLRTDWKSGIKAGLDISIELFKGFGEALMVILENMFIKIGNNVTVWVKRALASRKLKQQLYAVAMDELRVEINRLSWEGDRAGIDKLKAQARASAEEDLRAIQAAGWFEREYPTVQVAPVGPQLAGVASSVSQAIEDILNNNSINIDDAKERLRSSLEAITAAATSSSSEAIEDAAESTKQATNDLTQNVTANINVITDEAVNGAKQVDQAVANAMGSTSKRYQSEYEKLKDSKSIWEGFRSGSEEIKENIRSWGQIGYDSAYELKHAMGNAFNDMIANGANFKDAFKGFLTEIGQYMASMLSQQAASTIMGAFGFNTPAAQAHTGGHVGGLPMSRSFPSFVVPFAQRGHTGLKPDERLTVLRNDETVLTAAESGRSGGVQRIKLINETGVQARIEERPSSDNREFVLAIVQQGLQSDPRIRSAVRGVY